MVNFTKIFGLAGAVMTLTGLAYGQNGTCSSATTSQTPLIRMEGAAELVGEVVISCSGIPAGGALINITDLVSLPVTSKVLNTTSGASEAIAAVNGNNGTSGTTTTAGYTQGTYTGSQVTFSSVFLPAGSSTITIANVRVAATGVAAGATPPPVSETFFVSGSNLNANVLTAAPAVAYILPGLVVTEYSTADTVAATISAASTGRPTKTAVNSPTICTAIGSSSPLGSITIGKGFPTAFKGAGSTTTNATLGSEFNNNTETGVSVGVAGSNGANSGTIFQIVLANVPTGLSIYLPGTVYSDQGNGAALTLVTYSAGVIATAPLYTGTSSSISTTTGAVTLSSGSGTAFYSYAAGTNSATTAETFNIPIYGAASAGTLTPTTTAIVASVSFAPIGVPGNIPNFVIGASTTNLSVATFSSCSTVLLFPFVTSQLGFDTGIAISNTTSDPFGTKAQAGTCNLNFYGSPTTAAFPTASVAAGTTYTNDALTFAPGFQGYMIAVCNFQLAHGYAFISYGLGQYFGVAEGYLAEVLTTVTSSRTTTTAETLTN